MKNNKWIIAVIAVLVALVAALGILVAVLFLGGDDEKAEDRESQQQTTDLTEKKTTSENESTDQKETTGEVETGDEPATVISGDTEGIYIVVYGFEIFVPSDYYCFYSDNVGCIIELENVFQMKFNVGDKIYDEVVANKELLTEKSVNAGGEVVKEPQEVTVDGRKYIYFAVQLNDEKVYVVYTQAGKTDKTLAAQIVVASEEIEDDDILKAYAAMASSATETDKPDSTLDDIVEQQAANSEPDGTKTESTLTFENDSITYKVPEGLYSMGSDSTEYSAYEYFYDEDFELSVSCYLRPTEDYADAESYIQSMVEWESSVDDSVRVKSERVGDGVCYYFVSTYVDDEGVEIQQFYAAYNNSDTSIYIVQATAHDVSYVLSFDMFEEFFEIS